jgi:hypothetical protein
MAPVALKGICDMYRARAPAFVAYFEKNYVDNCKDWLRCGAVEGLEKPWLIPTGTQVAESYHAHLKAKDLKGRQVCQRSVLPSLLTPLLH